ncbi:MAG: TonB-dependent receptor plug domain-containing protein [Flavobacteriales bacterium]
MRAFLLLCVLSIMGIARAQTLIVKDQLTLQPLEFTTVTSFNPPLNIATNYQGKADITFFKGVDSIYIKHVGYKPLVISYEKLKAQNFRVLLVSNPFALDGFTVSVGRMKEEKKENTQKVVNISPKDVMLQNPQTAADLLGSSGEVFIQKSQAGGGSPMIRGFATNRVLITVDGVRMNTAIFRSGNVHNVISLDPFATASTEVIFGPGSVIYGSDAIGGVMNFYTLTPKLSQNDSLLISGNAASRYSSANFEKTGHFDLNIGLKKWAFVSSVSFSDFDDLRMGKNGPDEYLRKQYVQRVDDKDSVFANSNPLIQNPTGYSQYNLMQKVLFKPSEYLEFNYGFHYSKSSSFSRYDRLVEPQGNSLRAAEWNYGPQIWMMNSLQVQHSKESKLYNKAKLTLVQQYFEESRIDRRRNNNWRRTNTENVDAYSFNLDFEKKANQKHRIYYGLEYIYNQVSSTGMRFNIVTEETQESASRYPNGSTWNSSAAYLNYKYTANEKLTLQSGLRYNYFGLKAHFDTTFFPFPFTSAEINNGSVSGSLGAVYKPHKTFFIMPNLSTGFRSPNIDDIGKVFDSNPGNVMVPNTNLRAEYAYNAELTLSKTFKDVVKVDVTGFYTLLNNAFVRRNYTLNGQDSVLYNGAMSQVQALQNAAFATVYGLQAGMDVKLPKGFGLSSLLTYTLGIEELEDGTTAPLRHAAPVFGATRITYTKDRLKADLYGMYSGEVTFLNLAPDELTKPFLYAKDENGNPYSPAWFTLNFKIMYQLAEYMMVSGGVENIADLRYRPYSSGIVAPGRNFIVALRANF